MGNRDIIREIGTHVAKVDSFGTLISAGSRRRAANPFTLQSDWKDWHTYPHVARYAELDGSVCSDYYDRGRANVLVHVFYAEDWLEADRMKIKDPPYYS